VHYICNNISIKPRSQLSFWHILVADEIEVSRSCKEAKCMYQIPRGDLSNALR